MKSILRNIGLAVSTGVLTFLAFPPFELYPLAWIGFVPLLFVIRSAKGIRDSFFYSFLSGIVFFISTLYWLINITVPGTILLVLMLGFFWGIFGSIVKCVLKYSLDLLLIPLIWVPLEYIRGNIFTGFPWALLGYSQYKNIGIIQIADFTGPYGVSFLLVLFNVAVFGFFIYKKKYVLHLALSSLLILAAIGYGMYRLGAESSANNYRIGIVQGNIPQEYKWDASHADDIINEYINLTEGLIKDKPDLIIWPETAYPYIFEDSASEIGALAAKNSVFMLSGIPSEVNAKYYNSAILFDRTGQIVDIYHKVHLVPFGEYLPFERYLGFLRKSIDKPIGDFEKGTRLTLFSVDNHSAFSTKDGTLFRQVNFYKFGVLICFEDIFPYLAREVVKSGADFLVNITNDAWFGRSAAPSQHLQASVFRAVENRVPVVRAANTGISCFIDSFGRINSSVEENGNQIFARGAITHTINMAPLRTYYTLYGDVFVYLCMFIFAAIWAFDCFLQYRA